MSSLLPDPPRQRPGRFIAVVGPSGAGKDSVMDGICARRPDMHRVRRVITRAPDAGGEVFDPVSLATFEARVAEGAFALHWTAHGLSYGIPIEAQSGLARGHDVLANLSRGVLGKAAFVFPSILVLNVTAPPDVLLQRVKDRGREQGADMRNRLTRPAPAMPSGLPIIEIDNSGALEDSVNAALAALYPERA